MTSQMADHKYCKFVQASAIFWQSFETRLTMSPAPPLRRASTSAFLYICTMSAVFIFEMQKANNLQYAFYDYNDKKKCVP